MKIGDLERTSVDACRRLIVISSEVFRTADHEKGPIYLV